MTPTDRPQNPRECRHHNAKYCEDGMYIDAHNGRMLWHPCRLYFVKHCPDYKPKEKKDGE